MQAVRRGSRFTEAEQGRLKEGGKAAVRVKARRAL